ncbi:NAD-dependent protein deacetylase 2 [Microlunatus endophyticus]|uniref:protein acetyllysine N-acetyltransferase n=1 Tax=Microlunatus endophyticus TaxID=1716077 RepID=A0A917S0M9_9ACTN|nr:Sir2 family NAD-dependent protein deacetylase [Microlunatus endophyticus]GGL49202.1 NAD-dependent protein deacetylase 2 [Microlunatus endophyticus]
MNRLEEPPPWLTAAGRITVLTGAGISTAAGIPDFRGPEGVWTKDPEAERLSTLEDFLENPDVRRRAWSALATSPVWAATPTPAHRALVDLEDQGRIRALITQNIDGLHRMAGSRACLELHGNERTTRCLSCGTVTQTRTILDRVRGGDTDPVCARCGGMLKTTTVLFGEDLDQAVFEEAQSAVADCDVFLAVGTSFGVAPAAWYPETATAAGARIVIINREPTPADRLADLVVRDDIQSALPRLLRPQPS